MIPNNFQKWVDQLASVPLTILQLIKETHHLPRRRDDQVANVIVAQLLLPSPKATEGDTCTLNSPTAGRSSRAGDHDVQWSQESDPSTVASLA